MAPRDAIARVQLSAHRYSGGTRREPDEKTRPVHRIAQESCGTLLHLIGGHPGNYTAAAGFARAICVASFCCARRSTCARSYFYTSAGIGCRGAGTLPSGLLAPLLRRTRVPQRPVSECRALFIQRSLDPALSSHYRARANVRREVA